LILKRFVLPGAMGAGRALPPLHLTISGSQDELLEEEPFLFSEGSNSLTVQILQILVNKII
jgi:hypothetical protein